MLVGSWTKTIDRNKVNAVLGGSDPFDELTMCRSTDAGANPCAWLHLGPADRTVAVSLDCARH
jgi:hypothetical protein